MPKATSCTPAFFLFVFGGLAIGQAVCHAGEHVDFLQVVVRAETMVTVAAQHTGEVSETLVEAGGSVQKGDVILRLDSRQQSLEVEKVKHQVLRAEAAVEKARALCDRAESAVEYRKQDLERHLNLGESVAKSELRKLEEAAEVAEVQHVIAYQEYLQAKQQMIISQAELESAKLKLEQLSVTAPVSGVVNKVHVLSTNRLVAGDPIADLYVLEHMLCKVYLPESETDLNGLLGCSVGARFDVAGRSRELMGQVINYDPEVDARGLIGVTIKLPNQFENGRWLLLHGKTVDVTLLKNRHESDGDIQ